MKKRFIRSLLLGALITASTGTFVSCADYDDDINANKSEIQAAKTELSKLSSSVESLKTELANAKTSLQDEYKTQKAALETQIADASANLQTAINNKADQATVDDLSKTLVQLQLDLNSLKSAYEAKVAAIDKSIADLEKLIATKADVTYVEQAIATLQAAINGKVSTEDYNKALNDITLLQTAITNLTTAIGTKADQKDVEASVAAINTAIEQLKKDLEGKVSQGAFDALSEKVNGIAETVKSLQSAVATAATQASVDNLKSDLEKKIGELQAQVNGYVTTDKLQAAIDKINAAIDLLEAQLSAEVSKKADKSELSELRTQVQNIQTALDTRDENITKQLTDAINDLDKKLTELINTKVDQKDFDELSESVNDAWTAIRSAGETLATATGDIEGINEQIIKLWLELEKKGTAVQVENNRVAIAALNELTESMTKFLGDIENGTLAAQIAAAKTAMSKEAQDNLDKEIEARKEAIKQVGNDISDLRTELTEKIGNNEEDIKDLREKFNKINDLVDARVNENLADLRVFVNRSLKSISLVPQLFVGGIEAIEFNSLQYTPIIPGTSGLRKTNGVYENVMETQYVSGAKSILIDNGTAEAYYRLNPSIVDRASIDEENIEFLAATAQTRAATVTSPVKFNGIAEWNYAGKKGLVKVNLKKNTTSSLNAASDGNIYIVALKVPRKADEAKGIEAADIVSENSRLVENIMLPKIAHLAWNLNETVAGIGNVHHYTDSVTLWNTKVDANEGVYTEVNYNETYDVLAHVTGCNMANPHNQITKAQLKSYGLTFRFGIAGMYAKDGYGGMGDPFKAYGAPNPQDVDHSTNQQKFAKINVTTGILSSKLPDKVTDNRACVGKEPIIRIMLVDTVNNKLVDERYMKIKWVEKTKAPVTLEKYKTETTLVPCNTNKSGGIGWEWFITQVYAKAELNGLSQATFEAVYSQRTPTIISVNPNYSLTENVLAPGTAPATPSVVPTTNENGDALIASWTLEPQEISRIYPSQSKTFTAQILFKSSLPTEYPDLILPWEWTIKLPTLPSINGYYDNYWFTQYSLHDVMPVQYNSALYDQIAAGTVVPQGGNLETYALSNGKYSYTDYKGNPGGYCVFYNNLMNAFTYEQKNNVPQFIVKDLGKDCGTWDMQFTKAGTDKVNPALNYTQYTNYAPKFGTNLASFNAYHSPDLDPVNFTTFPAYRLYRQPWTSSEKQALQMVWDNGHVSWCGNPSHKQAILYADHNNVANQALLNKLAQTNEPDGRTPQRTHDKKVHIGIWGTLNNWNVIPVKDYDICLVEPIRINASLNGAFEEGYVSGTAVSCDDAFTMTDFRGYEVALNDVATARQNEWNKFRSQLYKYYEVGEPEWNLNDVRYGFVWSGSNVKADDTKTYANAMTAAKIRQYTNDNIVLSVEKKEWPIGSGKYYLVFKNNGGSNVEEEVNVFIPVSVTYGFGKVTAEAKVRLYPKGNVASGVTIVPYPGNN